MNTSSTARKSGPRPRTWPTGASAWCAPTRMPRHEFRRRIAALETERKSLEITQLRVLSASKAAGQQDPLSAVLKLKGTELLQATSELVMDTGGPLSMPDWAQELAALSNEP